MHRLFNEIENKTFLNTNPSSGTYIFGDLNEPPEKPGPKGTMMLEQELEMLFPEMMIPNNPIMFSNESKVEEEKDRRNDQLDMLIEHCRKLVSLKNAMNRTLPYGCRHF